jgi:GH15 family glucan-1,4-alpha-glucosidase
VRRGYDAARNTFVQAYDSPHLDASLLLLPQVGFLPHDDPRGAGTRAPNQPHQVVDGGVFGY